MAQREAEDPYRQDMEELSANMGKSLEQLNDLVKLISRQDVTRGRRGVVVAPATEQMKKRVGKVLEKMANVDGELDVDIACLADLEQSGLLQPSLEFDGSSVAKKGFKQIRTQMNPGENGRHREMIGAIQDRLTGRAPDEMMEVDGDDDGEDSEDFQVEHVVKSRKDPLTKEPITDPVKNKLCDHVYQRSTILKYIEQHRRGKRLCQCPCTACPNKKPLDPKDFEDFPEFLEEDSYRNLPRA